MTKRATDDTINNSFNQNLEHNFQSAGKEESGNESIPPEQLRTYKWWSDRQKIRRTSHTKIEKGGQQPHNTINTAYLLRKDETAHGDSSGCVYYWSSYRRGFWR